MGYKIASRFDEPLFKTIDGKTSPTEMFNSIQNVGDDSPKRPVSNSYDMVENDTMGESPLDTSGSNFDIHEAVSQAKENTKNAYKGLKSFLKPLTDKDFLLVVLTRFLVQMGIYKQEFLLWYIACTIQLPETGVCTSAKCALNLVLAPLIACSILSSTISGYLSDRFGGRRKNHSLWGDGDNDGYMSCICFPKRVVPRTMAWCNFRFWVWCFTIY